MELPRYKPGMNLFSRPTKSQYAIYTVGSVFLSLATFIHPEVMRFNLHGDWTTFWVGIVTLLIFIRILKLIPFFQQKTVPDLSTGSYQDMALAGLEDAAFTLPLLLVPGAYLIPLMIASSFYFACGHRYQGRAASAAKILSIPLHYYFAMKFGILTIIVAHAANNLFAKALVDTLVHFLKKAAGDDPILKAKLVESGIH